MHVHRPATSIPGTSLTSLPNPACTPRRLRHDFARRHQNGSHLSQKDEAVQQIEQRQTRAISAALPASHRVSHPAVVLAPIVKETCCPQSQGQSRRRRRSYDKGRARAVVLPHPPGQSTSTGTRTRRTIRMHIYLDGTEAALQDRA